MQVELATSSVRRQAIAILCGLAALLRCTVLSHFYNGGVGEASRWTSRQQLRQPMICGTDRVVFGGCFCPQKAGSISYILSG